LKSGEVSDDSGQQSVSNLIKLSYYLMLNKMFQKRNSIYIVGHTPIDIFDCDVVGSVM
jgi:hypothetical protein